MDFVLEVVSVASLVVGMTPLDAKALHHTDFPWGDLDRPRRLESRESLLLRRLLYVEDAEARAWSLSATN